MSRASREQLAAQEALPAYEISHEIGRGAFGVVYAARHLQLDRDVAIKQLPRAFAADPGVRERFTAEARMVASLEHPHIVPVYDFVDRDDGICLLVMERCQGSVGDRFQEDGLATDEACAAVIACCAALDHAHGAGLLHRDIKPENLMLDTKGVVKLGDFGIARALDSDARRTATGMVIGTPAYMSPEQVRGEDLTAASDVYSVGIMAYELLTGALPFPESPTATGLLAHHLVTEPTPLTVTRPELPGTVGAVIDRALAKSLDDRHGSALELASELAEACVRSFGTGWLRRRRFVLHWPEVLAVSETPVADSVRTGTILVKAPVDRDQLIGAPPPASDVLAAPPLPPADPNPSAAPPPPPPPGGSMASVGAPAPEPSTASTSGGAPGGSATSPGGLPKPVLVGGAVALVALVIGALALFVLGGDDGDSTADPSEAPITETPVGAESDTETDPSAGADPAGQIGEEVTTADDEVADTADPVDPDETSPPGDTDPGTAVIEFDGPALTTRPEGLDMTIVDSPWTPTPCPEGLERVACLFAGVSVDEDSGVIEAPYFTEGFVPEISADGYRMHFYLDSVVGGDERKAGSEVPGGSWKPWDGPYPFSSFGGPDGRTGFTVGDVQAAGARNLCVLVADPDGRAIPGTGNCAPIAQVFDLMALSEQVNRIEGRYIGRCGVGVTMIVPEGWRWVDLVDSTIDEAARDLRPTRADEMSAVLDDIVGRGAVMWADAPAEGEFIPSLHVVRIDADVTTLSSPDEVAAALAQRGVSISTATIRSLGGRDIPVEVADSGGATTIRYVVADFGYVNEVVFSVPDRSWTELTDAIAATVLGC